MKEDIYRGAKVTASAAIGAGTVLGAISGAGIGGFSAAGITSGLAALGAGSMLGGLLVVPALGYGAFKLADWVFTTEEEEIEYEKVYRKRSKRTQKKTSSKKK